MSPNEIAVRIGYWLAALLVATLPPALFYWFLIHPFARFWRRLGTRVTYTLVSVVCLLLAFAIFNFHSLYLAERYPFHWGLAIPGIGLYALSAYFEIQCRRHLKFRILAGVPEVDRERPGRLLTEGIYARVRNPRYLAVLLGMTGIALILNYPALYLTLAACVPAGWLLIVLEERELEERFGAEYVAYKKSVPRLIPRPR